MDAINSLVAGTQRIERTFDAAAGAVAADGLPTSANPDPTNPVHPDPVAAGVTGGGDLAGQLVTMTVAADMHHATTAALRSALSMYQDALDLLAPAASPRP